MHHDEVSLKNEITTNEIVNENINPLKPKSNGLFSHLLKFKIGPKTHDAVKKMNVRKAYRHKEITNPATVELNYCQQHAPVDEPRGPTACNTQSTNENIPYVTEEHKLPSVAISIYHSDSEVHDKAPNVTLTKSVKRKSRIPRAKNPKFNTTSRISRYAISRYSIRGNTRNSKKSILSMNDTIKEPIATSAKVPSLSDGKNNVESGSDVNEAECQSNEETEEPKDESSDDTDNQYPHVESHSNNYEGISSDDDSMLIERCPTCHFVYHCTPRKDEKNVDSHSKDETPSESNNSSNSSSSSVTIHSSDKEDSSSSIESNPPRRRRVRKHCVQVRANRSCAAIKSNSSKKSCHKLKKTHQHKEQRKYGFLRAVSDIVFWPFVFFRTEK